MTPPNANVRETSPATPDAKSRRPVVSDAIPVAILITLFCGLAAWSLETGGIDGDVRYLWVLACCATVTGCGLATTRISETWTQTIGVVAGIAIVMLRVLTRASEFGPSIRSRFVPFARYVLDWYSGRPTDGDGRNELVTFLVWLIVWLIAFFSGWVMIRRGWLLIALLLPGASAIANQIYGHQVSAWIIPAMTGTAVLLAVMHTSHVQRRRWERRRMRTPRHMIRRYAAVGLAFALVVGGAGSVASDAVGRYVLTPAVERSASAWQSVASFATRTLGLKPTEDNPLAAGYQQFGDGFEMTGPVNLSDTPMVRVAADGTTAPYLTARTYDAYTGRGWQSSSQTGPSGASGASSPELLFGPQQELVLSSDVTAGRSQRVTRITPLQSDSGVMYSVDTFLTADQQAIVRMSWQQLNDASYPVTSESLHDLPPTIQYLANLLLQAQLTGPSSGRGPSASSASIQRAVDGEVRTLSDQGLAVRWDASREGIVQTLYLTGELPVYDDVEAIFHRGGTTSAPATYRVTSLTSVATADELRSAPTTYPEWVSSRYVTPGSTVTQRTVDLAATITRDAPTAYDKAMAIEAYLRSNISYDTNVDAPPDGRDLVDWVLFDHKVGYCEHYASAMTVMLRTQGIPARTVVGYYPGTPDPALPGTFLYRQSQAHAWTEVYFEGYGWVPFEPTANRPLDQFLAPSPGSAGPTNVPTAVPTATQAVPTPDVRKDNAQATPVVPGTPFATPALASSGELEASGTSGGGRSWIWPILSLVTLAGIGAIWVWRRRSASRMLSVGTVYRRLERAGTLVGVPPASTETPREYGRRFVDRAPTTAEPVHDVVSAYERDQYGGDGPDEHTAARARLAWRTIRSRVPGLILHRRKHPSMSVRTGENGFRNSRLRGD